MSDPKPPTNAVEAVAQALNPGDWAYMNDATREVERRTAYRLLKVAMPHLIDNILPDPKGGCVCAWHREDRGGGCFETVAEYEPACPEHSEHVYNPRTGVWDLARTEGEIKADALDEAADLMVRRAGQLAAEWLRARAANLRSGDAA